MGEYVGRYAPSPTGALHLGSLYAALGSYLDARARGGRWLVRIDDLDTPRVVTGAAEEILETLARFGLHWDGPVLYQSQRREAYRVAVEQLKQSGKAFDCGCTRREARRGPPGIEGPIYPGTCRDGLPQGRTARSVRLRVEAAKIRCFDALQGMHRQRLARDIGDFVIRRADGITAYQLATVLDDAAQGVTAVVRGSDLLSSTPRQIYLLQALGLTVPRYAHLPVLTNRAGEKLGKSTGALALEKDALGAQLSRCLALLGQAPPARLADAAPANVLEWAATHWRLDNVPRATTLQAC